LFVLDHGRVRTEEVEMLARNGREAWIKTSLAAGTKVTMVPVACLFPSGSRSALFVLDHSRVRTEEVELLARNGREAWIKTSLAAGTKVIAYPPAGLKDGARVNVINTQ
jgi:HlyD family secretion protein